MIVLKMKDKKKPKILIVHRYPPEFELIPLPGLIKVYKHLSKYFSIVNLGMTWKDSKNEELRKFIKVKTLPFKIDIKNTYDKWVKLILFYMYLPFALLKIKKEKPDIIMCRELLPFVPFFMSLLKIPVIIEIGDWWPSIVLGQNKLGRNIANTIESFEVRQWNNRGLFVVAHNSIEDDLILRRGFSKKRITRINMPMYGGVYSPYNSKHERLNFGFANKDFVVGLHGIIHKSKGYDQVLVWWAKLVKIHPNWKLLFVGGTMGEGWFKKMINDLGIEKNIIMTGWISDQNVLNKYLNSADCLLATRRNTPDTLGNTPSAFTHNLMTGKPTITTGLPSIHEVITNRKNGFIFKPDNYESFKSELEYIYNNRKKANAIGKKGLKTVKEHYNANVIAQQYSELFKKIIYKDKK